MNKLLAIASLFLLSLTNPNNSLGEHITEQIVDVSEANDVQLTIETQGTKILLSWDIIRNQSNIESITIFRSIENQDFVPIHQIVKNDRSTDFVDHLLGSEVDAKNISYQVEVKLTNGSTLFSETKMVDLEERRALKPSIYTSGTTVNFEFYSQSRSRITAQVFNTTSRLMKQQRFSVTQGDNRLTINSANLRSGMYFLRLEQNGKSTTTKFFVR